MRGGVWLQIGFGLAMALVFPAVKAAEKRRAERRRQEMYNPDLWSDEDIARLIEAKRQRNAERERMHRTRHYVTALVEGADTINEHPYVRRAPGEAPPKS